jgi:hypothetical protein
MLDRAPDASAVNCEKLTWLMTPIASPCCHCSKLDMTETRLGDLTSAGVNIVSFTITMLVSNHNSPKVGYGVDG